MYRIVVLKPKSKMYYVYICFHEKQRKRLVGYCNEARVITKYIFSIC